MTAASRTSTKKTNDDDDDDDDCDGNEDAWGGGGGDGDDDDDDDGDDDDDDDGDGKGLSCPSTFDFNFCALCMLLSPCHQLRTVICPSNMAPIGTKLYENSFETMPVGGISAKTNFFRRSVGNLFPHPLCWDSMIFHERETSNPQTICANNYSRTYFLKNRYLKQQQCIDTFAHVHHAILPTHKQRHTRATTRIQKYIHVACYSNMF